MYKLRQRSSFASDAETTWGSITLILPAIITRIFALGLFFFESVSLTGHGVIAYLSLAAVQLFSVDH